MAYATENEISILKVLKSHNDKAYAEYQEARNAYYFTETPAKDAAHNYLMAQRVFSSVAAAYNAAIGVIGHLPEEVENSEYQGML